MSEPSSSVKKVLSVGQCCADHASISRVLRGSFGAEVVAADSAPDALDRLGRESFALVLVNRVLDADGASGLDVIRALREDGRLHNLPVMLVSNYDDAQEQAVAAGAVRGFGKASLGQPHMLARVESYLR